MYKNITNKISFNIITYNITSYRVITKVLNISSKYIGQQILLSKD